MLTTIVPTTAQNFPMDPVSVIVATLNGKLALHKSVDRRGYTITHVPTGFAVQVGIRNKKKAKDLMLVLENEDWNFKVPHSRKFKAIRARLKPIVYALPVY